jgi:hypothetical protein
MRIEAGADKEVDIQLRVVSTPDISIRAQVPRLKEIKTKDFDKLPWHVTENRKALHVEAKPEDVEELKELIQLAKESGIVALRLGKQAHISEVMDNDSTPREIKRMVKFAMKHTNYQGLMTGETITGISNLDGAVSPTAKGGEVSLRMVMITYLKMKDNFSLFAELHQTEALRPVLAITPACFEAELMVSMMNKQIAAYLYYYLKEAALPDQFVMDLLPETCDPTLVAEIKECEWDSDTRTLTTPQEKTEDKDLDKLESRAWYKNALDLQSLEKSIKTATSRAPEALFNLDAAQSVTTIHNRHQKPSFILEVDDDDDSEVPASAADTSKATPPRKNPNKEATRIMKALEARVSPPQEEVVEGTCAASGG